MIRSILSVPGHLEHLRAREHGADQIAWDLEDSVPAAGKVGALRRVLELVRSGDAVRVNADNRSAEIPLLAPFDVQINLPKVEKALDVLRARKLGAYQVRVLAVIESPLGVRNAGEICAQADAVAFGRADFRAASGLQDEDAPLILHAMAEIAMAALAAGIPVYDSPCEVLRDHQAMEREVRRAVGLGFTGKICIHPDQLPACWHFDPPVDSRLLGRRGTGTVELDGRVYAEPHFKLAEGR